MKLTSEEHYFKFDMSRGSGFHFEVNRLSTYFIETSYHITSSNKGNIKFQSWQLTLSCQYQANYELFFSGIVWTGGVPAVLQRWLAAEDTVLAVASGLLGPGNHYSIYQRYIIFLKKQQRFGCMVCQFLSYLESKMPHSLVWSDVYGFLYRVMLKQSC